MGRFIPTLLSLLSAVSLGLTSPAAAQPASQQAEKTQKELLTTLEKETQGKNIRFLDATGNQIAPEKLAMQPSAFRDGMSIESGQQRIHVRGELLGSGSDGAKLVLTHFVNNEIVNGQVIALNAGMTKREFESRLNDATESLFLNTLEAKNKTGGASDRKVASGSSADSDLNCGTKHLLIQLTTVIFFVSLLGFLIGGVTRPKIVSVFVTMSAMSMAWVTSPGSGNKCR